MPGNGKRNGSWVHTTCLNCLETFVGPPTWKYCSRKCFQTHTEVGFRIKKVCEYCQKSYEVIKSLKASRFCTRECWFNFRRDQRRKYTCIVCSKVFYSSNLNRKACSVKCGKVSNSQRKIETTGNVRNKTAKEYLKRINNSCWLCGYNVEPGVLQVHHKNRIHSDNRKDNIILLCPTCHHVDHYNKHDGPYAPPVNSKTYQKVKRHASN